VKESIMNKYINCIYFLNPQLIVGTYSKKKGGKRPHAHISTHSHSYALYHKGLSISEHHSIQVHALTIFHPQGSPKPCKIVSPE
jgi:hypothetical protein